MVDSGALVFHSSVPKLPSPGGPLNNRFGCVQRPKANVAQVEGRARAGEQLLGWSLWVALKEKTDTTAVRERGVVRYGVPLSH